jgi:primosomal replication protein N
VAKEYPAAVKPQESPEDVAKRALEEVAESRAAIQELLEWKRRQEEKESERLTAIRNDVLEVLVAHKATMIEIQTILKMLDIETVSAFISSRKTSSGGMLRLSSKKPTVIGGSKE